MENEVVKKKRRMIDRNVINQLLAEDLNQKQMAQITGFTEQSITRFFKRHKVVKFVL